MGFVDRLSRLLLLSMGLVLASAGDVLAEDARLGSGDVIRVTVYGHNDLSITARIGGGGEITFPLIGEVVIGGMSTREAEIAISNLLSARSIVKSPQVSLFVEEQQSSELDALIILGQVKSPGRFAVDSLSATGPQSIVGLLALAGGLTDSAAERAVLTRVEDGQQKQYEIDLVGLLEKGEIPQGQELRPGDVLFVPAMDVVYVYGQVNRPGRYRLTRNMTVMQAIVVSGGLTPRAREKGLSVKRRQAATEITAIEVTLNDILQPDDVLEVKESVF